MKVCIDQSKCVTAGTCVKICPEIFRFESGSKKAIAVVSEVPVSLENKCREAAQKCPEGAVYLGS